MRDGVLQRGTRRNNGWPVSIILTLVGIAVFCFIFTGMRLDRSKLGTYNRESEERNAEGDSAEDDFESPSQPMSVTDKYYNKLTGAVCGIIMLIATVMALLMLFVASMRMPRLGGLVFGELFSGFLGRLAASCVALPAQSSSC